MADLAHFHGTAKFVKLSPLFADHRRLCAANENHSDGEGVTSFSQGRQTMTLLESAAKALMVHHGGNPDSQLETHPDYHHYLDSTRLIVTALLPPSAGMIAAGVEKAESVGVAIHPSALEQIYRAIIDAALNE